MSTNWLDRLIISPCSNPSFYLDEVLKAYSDLGYKKFEVFTSWVNSAFDIEKDPTFYLDKAEELGLAFASLHLPPINDDMADSLDKAIKAAHFAEKLGVNIVLYKANSRENYINAAKPFLDATEHLAITPVLQNHSGSPISTLENFTEVINGIDDTRMKTLLEVGHFHSVGVSWKQGYDLLKDTIALVHIKDQIGTESIPYGTGEIDLPALFKHMQTVGYTGDYVVEMEVKDYENTIDYLAQAKNYIEKNCKEYM